LLTAASLGFYLPFSAIAAQPQTSFEAVDVFQDNTFTIELKAEDYQDLKEEVACRGEGELVFRRELIRK
jgi:hypothetical protein